MVDFSVFFPFLCLSIAMSLPFSYFIWGLSVLLGSSSSILTRLESGVPASSIGFWRVAGAALLLAPWAFHVWIREGRPRVFTAGVLLTGLLFGLHFATWSWVLVLPGFTIANAMLFIGLQPLMAPWIARPLLGERLTPREIAGCVIACLGMAWIFLPQLLRDHGQAVGSAVTLLSAFLCAAYFVLTRKYRVRTHVMLFSVGVFTVAAAVLAATALLLNGHISIGETTKQRLAILGLVLLPTIGGHVLAMFLLRHVKSQMATLSIPTQFVIGTLVAMPLFGEYPVRAFWLGAVLVMVGVVLGILPSAAKKPGGR